MNGRIVDGKSARVSVFDRGFLYGDGAFETMRSYDGTVFRIDKHLDRLFRSLKRLAIRYPHPKKYLKDAVYRTLSANGLKDAYIRLTVTRGEGRIGMYHKDRFRPNAVIVARGFYGYPAKVEKGGVSAKIIDFVQNESSFLSSIKSLNFLGYITARMRAQAAGYDEAILTNTKGDIAEAATSNIFFVRNGRLVTPGAESGILEGVTRKTVLEIAKRSKIRVSERRVTASELLKADEVFLTNSLAEVIPVTSVDSRKIGGGRVGDMTVFLRALYRAEVRRETKKSR